ncbi:MAG: hypothetical protein GY801_33755 [bacterium]|nr:hypothetical protein [bacterium]
MNTSKRDITVEITTEEQIHRGFVEAWHGAEEYNVVEPEERLCFLGPKTLFHVLSQYRLELLPYTARFGTH